MDFGVFWTIADRARNGQRLTPEEVELVQVRVPKALAEFPDVELPKRVRHPAGFSITGAPVGTFLRSALVLSGQRALGKRFDGVEFYERVEKDLAFGIMRSHFHHGYPKGTHCCAQCTLAVYPVLEAEGIRYFDCRPLAESVRELIEEGKWRFGGSTNTKMVRWSLGQSENQP
jgi:hypothetical protein